MRLKLWQKNQESRAKNLYLGILFGNKLREIAQTTSQETLLPKTVKHQDFLLEQGFIHTEEILDVELVYIYLAD